jgi:hypothetical protein
MVEAKCGNIPSGWIVSDMTLMYLEKKDVEDREVNVEFYV